MMRKFAGYPNQFGVKNSKFPVDFARKPIHFYPINPPFFMINFISPMVS
jgi:hypothetical protein